MLHLMSPLPNIFVPASRLFVSGFVTPLSQDTGAICGVETPSLQHMRFVVNKNVMFHLVIRVLLWVGRCETRSSHTYWTFEEMGCEVRILLHDYALFQLQ